MTMQHPDSKDETAPPLSSPFKPTEGEYEPPITAETIRQEGEKEEAEKPPPGAVAAPGKAPLMPSFIRGAAGLPGELLATLTKWEGWKLSPEELNDVVELVNALNIEMDAKIQLLLLIATLYGGRVVGYGIWRRQGGALGSKEKPVGAMPEKEKEIKEAREGA